jgi:hypothetical protein
MQFNVIYYLYYNILNLRDIKARRHDLFQNNSTIQFSYTLMNIREASLSKLHELN